MHSPNNPILLQIGPIALRWYGLLIMGGALLGAYVATFEAKRRKLNEDHVWNALLWALILGFLGARLYHVLSTPAGSSGLSYYFSEKPFDILTLFGFSFPFPTALMIWRGGIGIFGGLAGGVLGLLIYARRNKVNFLQLLDVFTPGMLLGQAIGRWGNYFNQELYGPPTTLPWGIKITNPLQRIPPYNDLATYPLETTTFHPVFFYESLWNFIGLGLVLWLGRKWADKLRPGDVASFYLIWYPVGRFLVESLRPDAWTMSGIPTAQLVSIALLIIGVGTIVWRHRGPAPVEAATAPASSVPGPRRPRRKPK